MEIVRVLADYLTFLCLFVLSNFMENVDGLTTADIGSPLRVAQCRVECISKFSRSSLHHKTCLHGSDCKMCWQNCQLLQSNFPVWGALCAEKALCYPGCEAACRFALATDNSQQRSPVLVRRAEEVLRVNGQDVRWPPPPSTPSSPPNTPYIYLVMRKSSAPGSAWKQLTQTIDLSARVPHDPGGMLRVLVVGREGLRTVYSPLPRSEGQPSARETAREVMRSLGREGRLLDVMEKSAVGAGKRINTARPVVAQKGVNWNLRLISKIHQQVLVIAEVAWDAQTTTAHVHKPLYLVTWEVEGGGIQGNLFTDVSCVTLSLWPNTVFHIQVELVNQQDSIALSKSEILLVDTRPALDAITEHQPHVKVLNVATTEQRPQFFSGAAAALVSFLILLLVLACTRHCLLDRVIAHSKLVEDLPYGPNLHRVFPPVVTIVQDMRRPSTSKLVTLKKDDIDDWDSS